MPQVPEPRRAVILAAGRGSRMREATADRPKCLVPLAGRPLLEWQIRALRGGGMEAVALVTGYLGGQLADRADRCFENPRWQETNMVQSLVCAGEWLQAAPCLVSYADIVYNAGTVRKLAAAEGDLVITFDPHWRELWEARFEDPLADAETFRRDAGGRLVEIGGRARSLEEIQGQYMGLLKFTPAGWRGVCDYLAVLSREQQDRLDMTALLAGLLRSGFPIDTVPVEDRWLEVDSEQDLELYEQQIAGKGDTWFQRP